MENGKRAMENDLQRRQVVFAVAHLDGEADRGLRQNTSLDYFPFVIFRFSFALKTPGRL
jgi:hypothetical protein